MKILVTGGTGFIGSNVANRLVSIGHDITIIGSSTEQKVNNAKLIELNLGLNLKKQMKKIESVDVCYHFGGSSNNKFDDKEVLTQSNINGPLEFFKYLNKDLGCQNFIYASSCNVYSKTGKEYIETKKPSPSTVYDKINVIFEKKMKYFANKSKVNVVGLRCSKVYGPGESHKNKNASMIYHMIQDAITKNKINICTPEKQTHDWIYIDDVVDAFVSALEFKGNEIFNIALGKSYSNKNIAEIIKKSIKAPIELNYVDCDEIKKSKYTVKIEKASTMLNFSPKFDIVDGIKQYLNYFNIVSAKKHEDLLLG